MPPTQHTAIGGHLGSNFLIHDLRDEPSAIDAFVLRHLHELRRHYTLTGNPQTAYLAAIALADAMAPLRSTHDSFQFAQLQAFIAEMLLAEGRSADRLHAAIRRVECATDIMYSVPVVCTDVIRAEVSAALLHAIARKALGQFDEGVRWLRGTTTYLAKNRSAMHPDLVPLFRQEIMMHQHVAGHQKLLDESVHYRALRPLEYYRSLKRVFEFLSNRGQMRAAEQLFPEFKRSFAAVANLAPPISHVSFLKNVGHYVANRRQKQPALEIFARAQATAERLKLAGQARQIAHLAQQVRDGANRGELTTFLVS